MSRDSSDSDDGVNTVATQESLPSSINQRELGDGEDDMQSTLTDQLVTGRDGLQSSISNVSLQVDADEDEAVVMVPDGPGAGMSPLKRERFAREKKESTDSSESSKSGDDGDTTYQDTGSQSTSKVFTIARKWFCDKYRDKNSTPKSYKMEVNIPTHISKSRYANANLHLEVMPYKTETSPWPDRFSYLLISLQLPQRYVRDITCSNSCTLHLNITVKSLPAAEQEGNLTDDSSPLEIQMEVPEGASEASVEEKLLRYPTVLDATCKNIEFVTTAKFDLTPRKLSRVVITEMEGYVDISQKSEPALSENEPTD